MLASCRTSISKWFWVDLVQDSESPAAVYLLPSSDQLMSLALQHHYLRNEDRSGIVPTTPYPNFRSPSTPSLISACHLPLPHYSTIPPLRLHIPPNPPHHSQRQAHHSPSSHRTRNPPARPRRAPDPSRPITGFHLHPRSARSAATQVRPTIPKLVSSRLSQTLVPAVLLLRWRSLFPAPEQRTTMTSR